MDTLDGWMKTCMNMSVSRLYMVADFCVPLTDYYSLHPIKEYASMRLSAITITTTMYASIYQRPTRLLNI